MKRAESHDLEHGELGFQIERELRIWLVRSADDSDLLTLPPPKGGYGGHELVVSDDEQFVALWVYSGQSDAEYQLFETRPALRHLGSFDYLHGMGDAPRFSPNARWLVTLLRFEEYEFENDQLPWAVLQVRDLVTGSQRRVDLVIETAAPPDERTIFSWTTYGRLSVTDAAATIALPWGGDVAVPLPIEHDQRSVVMVDYPGR